MYLLSTSTYFHRRTIPALYEMRKPVSLHTVINLLYRIGIFSDKTFHLEILPMLKEIADFL